MHERERAKEMKAKRYVARYRILRGGRARFPRRRHRATVPGAELPERRYLHRRMSLLGGRVHP